MKSFQTLQEIFEKQFIFRPEPTQRLTINWKNVLVVLMQGLIAAQMLAFLLFQAKSNRERGDSLYISSTAIVCINHYLIYIKRKGDTFILIDNFDKFIEKSEQHLIQFYDYSV